jgi:hypothetical protein
MVYYTAADTPTIFPSWPVDESTGYVSKVKVTILEGAHELHELIRYAMHLKTSSGFTVVKSTYIDVLSAGRGFLAAVCASAGKSYRNSREVCSLAVAKFTKEMTLVYKLTGK